MDEDMSGYAGNVLNAFTLIVKNQAYLNKIQKISEINNAYPAFHLINDPENQLPKDLTF